MFASKVSAINQRRAKSAPLPQGISPVVSSQFFKSTDFGAKPVAAQHQHHLSVESLSRQASTLKAAAKVPDPSTVISLGTARPHSETLPWNLICFDTAMSIDAKFGNGCGSPYRASSGRGDEAYDLNVALNYGYAAGSPQILRFITEHVELVHDPPYQDWAVAMTCGSTSAIDIVLRMLCNRGDHVLAEEFTYPGFSDVARSMGLKVLGITMDADGLNPAAFEQVLADWDLSQGRRPHALYMVPTGQNPTGITQSAERRKSIYEVADRYDVLIIEDDPYYFLQLVSDEGGKQSPDDQIAEVDRYLSRLPPSYLSLDRSGRVIRLDAASKILAPGLRCGWMTASSELIDRFIAHTELCVVSPSGLSQLAMFKLLDETWGHEGFILWLSKLSQRYTKRLEKIVTACQEFLPPKSVCRYEIPSFGMFVWIELSQSSFQRYRGNVDEGCCHQACVEIENSIYLASVANGVLVSKGSWFSVGSDSQKKLCFRLTFAAASEASFDSAVKAFSRAVWREHEKANIE